MQAEGQMDRKQLCRKRHEGSGGQQVEHEPAVLIVYWEWSLDHADF